MRQQKLAVLLCGFLLSVAASAQLFKPLGLGIVTPNNIVTAFRPQMYVDGDVLYVGTKQGIYSKILSQEGSEWQLIGFEGIPVLDFVRKGADIFALCFVDDKDALFRSNDGGKTYEDVTPDNFKTLINKERHLFWYFAQHPTNPDTFLLSSFNFAGIHQTTDFGRTWTKLSIYTPDFIGFHPLNPDIIYECGGGKFTDEKTDIRISYDAGQTWEAKDKEFSNYNEVYHITFHPTNPDIWIAGGRRCIYTSYDNGKTWLTQDQYDNQSSCQWSHSAFDEENSDIVYLAEGRTYNNMSIICSVDGGKTWGKIHHEPVKNFSNEWIFDMKQYRDKLLIYSQSDVYEISKSALIDNTTAVHGITPKAEGNSLHDLQGRQLQHEPARGVFIKDGRKWVK